LVEKLEYIAILGAIAEAVFLNHLGCMQWGCHQYSWWKVFRCQKRTWLVEIYRRKGIQYVSIVASVVHCLGLIVHQIRGRGKGGFISCTSIQNETI